MQNNNGRRTSFQNYRYGLGRSLHSRHLMLSAHGSNPMNEQNFTGKNALSPMNPQQLASLFPTIAANGSGDQSGTLR